MTTNNQVFDASEFELYDEIDSLDTMSRSTQENNDMTNSMSHGLDGSNYSSINTHTSMMTNNQVFDASEFELYDEIDSLDTMSRSAQENNDMTNSMSHGLDGSNYSSVSVYSTTSISSNKTPGDPEIAEHFLNLARKGNASPHTLNNSNLERVAIGSV